MKQDTNLQAYNTMFSSIKQKLFQLFMYFKLAYHTNLRVTQQGLSIRSKISMIHQLIIMLFKSVTIKRHF